MHNWYVHAGACVCVGGEGHYCAEQCVCVCTMCVILYDCSTHLDMAVSFLFTRQNTATATTPAMAAVNRTPPIKPPMVAPTPVLKQPHATYVYVRGKDIVRSRASIHSCILAFAEWARHVKHVKHAYACTFQYNIYVKAAEHHSSGGEEARDKGSPSEPEPVTYTLTQSFWRASNGISHASLSTGT